MPPSTDILQGTLDLLILKTLALESMHGWGIAQRIQQVSKDALQIGQGSLYPALHRLEYKGWIRADWGPSENNRRAKFYSLTRTGKKQLEAELENWDRLNRNCAGAQAGLEQFRNYCGLKKVARCGFPWEKTTKRPVASVYTHCETGLGGSA